MLEGYPISPLQKQIWLRQDPARPFQVVAVVQIVGPFRRDWLRQSLQTLVTTHDILSYRFIVPKGLKVPLQVPGETPSYSWREIPVQGTPQDFLAETIAELENTEIQWGEHTLEAILLSCDEATNYLLLRLPAVCCDGPGMRILVESLASLYAACRQGQLQPEEVVQYHQFGEWLEEVEEEEAAEEGVRFWEATIEKPAVNSLIQPRENYEPTCLTLALPRVLSDLAENGERQPDELWLAVWATVLARLQGGDPPALQVAVDGREFEELAETIGPFTRFLPVNVEVKTDQRFNDWADQLADQLEEITAWQSFFHLASDESFNPEKLFAFSFHQGRRRYSAGEAEFVLRDMRGLQTVSPLGLHVENDPDEPLLYLYYDRSRFNETVVRHIGRRVIESARALAGHPDYPALQIAVVDREERKRLSASAGVEKIEPCWPEPQAIHRLFARHVDERPEQPALVFGDNAATRTLCFSELNRAANQVAHQLLSHGVGPGDRVALFFDRSLEAVCALLGVLKAGAVYLPLDVALPPKRIAGLVEDAGTRLILCDVSRTSQLEHAAVPILPCHGAPNLCPGLPDENPNLEVDPNQGAYLMYTSGSTGKPKGVLISHSHLFHYVDGVCSRLGLQAGWSYATVSTLAADLGNTMIFPALCLGGTLHVISGENISDGAAFGRYCLQHSIDALKITPTHLNALMNGEQPANVLPQRCLILGGEATPWDMVEHINDLRPDLKIFNHYGPTETCVGVMTYAYRGMRTARVFPLGFALPHAQTYVLDAWGEPLPQGIAGELCIGGPAVACGYLGRAALTAQVFVPDPFSEVEGARLYRTGDKARVNDDGTTAFLGRIDHQVKVRGYRIELKEIETCIERHGSVKQAVVLVWREEVNSAQAILAAYVVLGVQNRNETGQVEELRAYLKEYLPVYMIPTHFFVLNHLPVTANGKVDRRSLPDPRNTTEIDGQGQAPRNAAEEKMTALWQQVLGVEVPGIDHNFFNLGGHSLSATILLARTKESFETLLSLTQLFDHPTIRGLCRQVYLARIKQAGDQEARRVLAQIDPTLASHHHVDFDLLDEDILEQLSGRLTSSEVSDAIVPQPRGEAETLLPMSFAQQRLWFIYQYLPDSPLYNVVNAAWVRGAVDASALNGALNTILARHEVLRTVFTNRDGAGYQRILPFEPIEVEPEDLSGAEDPTDRARRRLKEETLRPLDLEQGPVFRFHWFKAAEDLHVWVLNIHHIASDGFSNGVFLNELSTVYKALLEGSSPSLPELPVQYADYAVWQRGWLTGEGLERQLGYWRDRLEGATVLKIPTDFPRPAQQTFRGGRAPLHFPTQLTEGLRRLGEEAGAGMFTTLLSLFKLLLARYSGSTDITVGVPFAGRNRSEVEHLIGFFINILPIRARFSERDDFRGLLASVRREVLGAQDHQDIPFEKLVDELQPERDTSRTPLFQVVLNFQSARGGRDSLGDGLAIEPMTTDTGTAKFDLTLSLTERDHEIRGWLDYNADLFSKQTAERLVTHLHHLALQAVRRPEKAALRLSIFDDREWSRLTGGGHYRSVRTQADNVFAEKNTPHELFETQADLRPTAIALTYGDSDISYEELNRRANRLAHFLIEAEVGPEVRVGLCLERKPEYLIALLAVLKAGGIYVPLDPTYPAERLDFIAGDAGLSLILCERAQADKLPSHLVSFLEDIDLKGFAGDNPVPRAHADNGAYIIYTSGSTGRPKGVVIPHGNVVRLLGVTQRWFGFHQDDVWTLFHSLGFDFSVWEIWGALCFGGRLVMVPFWVSRSPEDFYPLLVKEEITVLNQSPSAFRQLVNYVDDRDQVELPALRYVIFGGEALQLNTLGPWFKRFDDQRPRLINMYGITETTVHVTYREISADEIDTTVSPVGEVIPDLDLYVLDKLLTPVPVGAGGEVFVSGPGLARGYLERPSLTATRFLPNPFAVKPGSRMYAAGDVARLSPEGDILFEGRADDQVQIRGHRVEPGEVEAALESLPDIKQAFVTTDTSEHGGLHLVAYLVTVEGATQATLNSREDLAHILPDYMIPAFFVFLERFPLTVHGKLDKAKLSAMDKTGAHTGAAYQAPAGETEEILSAIWAGVLNVDRIGRNDNFFALGGDSILSIQVLTSARARGLNLSLQQLFQTQTIRELAALADREARDTTAPQPQTPFAMIDAETRAQLPEGVEDAYPMSRLQLGMIYHQELSPETLPYHNVVSFLIQGRLQHELFERAVAATVARHPIFRTGFFLNQFEQPLQLVFKQAQLPVTWEDLSHLNEQAAKQRELGYVQQERSNPFDLKKPTLLRFHIQELSEMRFRLTITECHAILDGWSLTSALTEIFNHYFDLVDGRQSQPSPLRAHYRDYIYLEQQALQSEQSRTFWRADLADATRLPLPETTAAKEPKTYHKLMWEADDTVSRQLQQLANSAQVPLKSVLLTAHLRVLAQWTGQSDVLTSKQMHGRPELEDGEKIYGLFLNAMPFRFNVQPCRWLQLVRSVFEKEQACLPHRRFPMAEISEWYEEREMFQTFFNFVHFHATRQLAPNRLANLGGESLSEEPSHWPLMISFRLNPQTGIISLSVQGRGDVLSRGQIEDVLDYFKATLHRMASLIDGDAEAHHDSFSCLSQAGEQALLQGALGRKVSFTAPRLLHRALEHQAEVNPRGAALLDGACTIDFATWNANADNLAFSLRARGAGPERTVALLLSRSAAMPTAIFGVLKAGAAYVPLDPEHPPERLLFQCREAGVHLLVTSTGHLPLADHLQQELDNSARVVLTDDGALAAMETVPTELPPVPTLDPANLAYVLFTSGSTGRPKGVAVSHGAVLNHLCWKRTYLGIECEDRVLLKTPYTFDVSIWELFLPVMAGATMVIAEPNGHKDSRYLADLINKAGVTAVHFVPSMLALFLETAESDLSRHPRMVLCSGEALGETLVARFRSAMPDTALFNLYGPTEAAVEVSAVRLDGLPPEMPVTIGTPIANCETLVLGPFGHPVTAGASGRLMLGGANLARGYMGRPALTASLFVPHPFGRTPGERLYDTGDLVRNGVDGELTYLGRADFQVKLRGQRIELGEIEELLLEQADVQHAAVCLRRDVPEGEALAAFITAARDRQPDEEALRRELGKHLPSYMVPSYFQILDALPLTPSGKTNRRALDRLPLDQLETDSELHPDELPQTPAETRIAELFGSLLGLDLVGRHANFFRIGGHSLLAIRLISRLRRLFELDLPMKTVFEHPTPAALASALSRQPLDSVDGAVTAITHDPDLNQYPLSLAQERLWLEENIKGTDATYNMPAAVNIRGLLSLEALTHALTAVHRRHHLLHSRLQNHQGNASWLRDPHMPLPMVVIDLSGEYPVEAQNEILAQAARKPFDLTGGESLYRIYLIVSGDQSYCLMINLHHMLADGWSLQVLFREFGAFYKAYIHGEELSLSPLAVQYGDVARWQREERRKHALDRQLAYWQERLADAPPVLEFPTDRPRSILRAFGGATLRFKVPEDTAQALAAIGKQAGVTPFMTTLSVFAVLLAKYSRQNDLCIGSPIANRDRAETQDLIGFFLNTLVLRLSLSPDDCFQDVLRRVHGICLAAYQNQEIPFEKVVEAVQPERRLDVTPIFQVMFTFIEAGTQSHDQPRNLTGLEMEGLNPDTGTAKFELSMTLASRDGGFDGSLQYNTDLFEESTAVRIVNHFQMLAQALAVQSDQSLHRISMLGQEERLELLVTWNQTQTDFGEPAWFHEHLSRWARQSPEAPAVIFDETVVTYADFQTRTISLAHRLQELGVGRETLVGVCMERSVELVLTLHAILKAGGAYVPLDPQHPAERIAFMLEDAGISLLVADENQATKIPADVAVIHPRSGAQTHEDINLREVHLTGQNLAYMIYTSGSTGRPKGTGNSHAAIANNLSCMQQTYQLEPGHRVMLKTPYTFDVSLWELFWPFQAGATLVIARPEGHKDPRYLADLIARTGITHMCFVPSMLSVFLEMIGDEELDTLCTVLCAGEALSRPLVTRFFGRFPQAELHNLFGPTESAITVTEYHCAPGMPDAPVPIGRPIGNVKIYILDQHMMPLPQGVPGQLFIAGAGLARGYHQRPGLTASVFCPNPFAEEAGERLYAAGDLARLVQDEHQNVTIAFLGRIDHQIKLRGLRIELGEIEACLCDQRSVADACVVVREDQPGNQRLVAYVVPSGGHQDNLSLEKALATQLATRLPEYMIPAAYMFLERLPLTPSGKVGRKRLPKPEVSDTQVYVPARNEWEQMMVDLWQELLPVKRVSITDSFFALGGHSLMTARLVSRVHDTFGSAISFKAVFTYPILQDLVNHIRGLTGTPSLPTVIEPIPRSSETPIPLSFSQQRLWVLNRLESDSGAYNIPFGFHLAGRPDLKLIQICITEIQRRHETLRTRYAMVDEEPRQIIDPPAEAFVTVIDLSGLHENERQPAAQCIQSNNARLGFSLEHGPIMRTVVCRLAAEDHLLLLNIHHIATDGLSSVIFFKEFSTLYAGRGKASLPALPIQYADYAVHQRNHLTGEVLEKKLDYWNNLLQFVPRFLDMPLDKSRPMHQTFSGRACHFEIDEDFVEAARALRARLGITPFMLYITVYGVLLSRYANQSQVCIGTPVANRDRTELEDLIGFFVNTLVLPIVMEKDGIGSFTDLLLDVRETILEAFSNADTPFEQIVARLEPERDLARTPLFQAFFSYTDYREQSQSNLKGLRASAGTDDNSTAKFELSLTLVSRGRGLAGSLEYNTDLFEEATALRIVKHFQMLAQALVRQPDELLHQVSMLSEEERHELLVNWNQTQKDFGEPTWIHETSARWAQQSPEAPAVIFGDTVVTYAEFHAKTDSLAHRLRELGVGLETLVGVCMERSAELVLTLHAILKAGGAYVPLDPHHPAERIAFMLEDAGITLLVADEHLKTQLPEHVSIFHPQNDAQVHEALDDANMSLTDRNLAYMIYTSGSTGKPKGTGNTHGAIANNLSSMQRAYQLKPEHRVMLKTPYTFDVSVWELFWPFQVGAALVVTRPEGHQDPRYMADLVVQTGVSHMCFVPSMLSVFLEMIGDDALDTLRTVLCAGEALPRALVTRFFERFPQAELHNLYGPTESSIVVSKHRCTPGMADTPVSIGGPISNVTLYVLDRQMMPVPLGVPGQLSIGGAGLARGYHQRPGLTASVFGPNPFAEEAGERLYASGDLARLVQDEHGNLTVSFLGRIDHQVKLRGLRVELGEIEARLGEHGCVSEACVVVREDQPGNQQLVAYVIPVDRHEDEPVRERALASHLAAGLPEYMVPTTYVFLERFPLTPSGKIDRKRLPKPERNRQAYVPPRNEWEQKMVDLWLDLLQVEQVGVTDSFFALGGHSLMTIRLVSRVYDTFGVTLSFKAVFTYPVLEDLVQHIRGLDDTASSSTVIMPAARTSETPIPLSFAQERLWVLDRLDPDTGAYNIPFGFHLEGALDLQLIQTCITEIQRRHETLRTRYAMVEDEPRQLIDPPAETALTVIDLSGLREAERRPTTQHLQSRNAGLGFSLEHGPVMRTVVCRLAENDHLLLLNIHHIATDGLSSGVFFKEFSSLYAGQGKANLPELPIQYADYAIHQRNHLTDEVLAQKLDYWSRLLEHAPRVLDMPLDKPRPTYQTFAGRACHFEMDEGFMAEAQALRARLGITPFMLYITMYGLLLSRYANQSQVCIGTPVANRDRTEIEGLIGFFVNTLVIPIVAEKQGVGSFVDLLLAVKETVLEAFSNADTPFEQVVSRVEPERDLSRTALFQAFFAITDFQEKTQSRLSGLKISSSAGENNTAKFELGLTLSPQSRGPAGSLRYNTDLFKESTALRLVRHFQILAQALVRQPDEPLHRVSMLSREERREMLVTWNNTRMDFDETPWVHDIPSRRARQHPELPAVIFEDTVVSYAAFQARTHHMAHRLRDLGVRPESLVGVCMERSAALVITLHAILKAGGAYVPIDTQLPAERIAFMLEDAGIGLVVADAHLEANLPENVTVCSPDVAGETDRHVDHPHVSLSGQNRAYMIYTSGSTGKPKGVAIDHASLLHRLLWMQAAFDLGPDQRVLQKTPYYFDVSVWEFFWPFMAGATLVIAEPEGHKNSAYMAELIESRNITLLHFVPSMLSVFLEEAKAAKVTSLRKVLTGGEALPTSLHDKFLAMYPNTELHHLYGPTEVTIDATWMPHHGEQEQPTVPIGRAIGNVGIYILDPQLNPVPVGVPGQLYIAGSGLARGYHG
ncbi:MAG: non-ribosomal peptide synthase/polyketide synthase, partial [Acidobacteriota bacterium]|nr:non-ribosomal peptide synthase/polyketide synthase [Acidobacteriota bacterium]